MWGFITQRMEKFKDSYFSEDNNKIYYSEVISRASSIGEKLKTQLPGRNKCAILCESSMDTGIIILACWYADMIPIPMSKHYGLELCKDIIEEIQPDLIISEISNIDDVVEGEGDILIYDYKKDVWSGRLVCKEKESCLKNIVVILCTSGTTGKPKGVLISNLALQNNVMAIVEYFLIKEKNKILIARPLYHCAVFTGEFLASLYNGLNLYFFSGNYNPFAIKKYLFDYDIEVMCGTPTLLRQIAESIGKDKQLLPTKIIALSGECLTKNNSEKIRAGFKEAKIYNVYGLTEAAPRVSYLPYELFDIYPESVGYPLKNTFISIRDENGKEVEPGIIGNITIKSPSLMNGYYHNEKLTNQKIKEGWLVTGDVGYLEQNGLLYICGRSDDMIIKAGLNIYPREIENILIKLEFIEEVLAYGLKTENGQEIVVDIVLSKKQENMSNLEVMRKMQKVLPKHLMPRKANIVEKLKRNASGKVVRPKC